MMLASKIFSTDRKSILHTYGGVFLQSDLKIVKTGNCHPSADPCSRSSVKTVTARFYKLSHFHPCPSLPNTRLTLYCPQVPTGSEKCYMRSPYVCMKYTTQVDIPNINTSCGPHPFTVTRQ